MNRGQFLGRGSGHEVSAEFWQRRVNIRVVFTGQARDLAKRLPGARIFEPCCGLDDPCLVMEGVYDVEHVLSVLGITGLTDQPRSRTLTGPAGRGVKMEHNNPHRLNELCTAAFTAGEHNYQPCTLCGEEAYTCECGATVTGDGETHACSKPEAMDLLAILTRTAFEACGDAFDLADDLPSVQEAMLNARTAIRAAQLALKENKADA